MKSRLPGSEARKIYTSEKQEMSTEVMRVADDRGPINE
jgi:hypothetical protein